MTDRPRHDRTRYDRTEVEGPTVPLVTRTDDRTRSDDVNDLRRELVTIRTRLERIEESLDRPITEDQ